MVTGRSRWLQVVRGGYRWLWGGNGWLQVVTSGYGWLWVVLGFGWLVLLGGYGEVTDGLTCNTGGYEWI